MSKVKKKHTPPSKHDTAHLEDKITEVSDTVAVLAKRYRVPVVVVVVAVVGILGLSSIFQWFSSSRQQELASQVYQAFDLEDKDQKRARLAELADELQGASQEPVFVARYAKWLWEQDGAPEKAVKVLEGARARHPDDAVLEFTYGRMSNTFKQNEGFQVPTPPPPPEPVPAPSEAAPTPAPTEPQGAGTTDTPEPTPPSSPSEDGEG